jgi:hypothetical protein
MSEADRYDVFVLGSGAGGKLVAWTMAREEGLKYLFAGVPPLARDAVEKHGPASAAWDC